MGMHLNNSWQEKLCISVCIVAIINQFIASLHWGHDSWQMTEWLINYAGGFVRRGLPGEIILLIAEQIKIQENYIVIFTSFATYILVFAIIRSKSKSFFSSAFLLSPVALGSPAYQDFIVRKDVLGILLLLACLHCNLKIKNPFIRLLTCNALACFAILSHEAFFFYALPALIFINANLRSGAILTHCKKIAISCVNFILPITTFLLVTHFHGSWVTAKKINASLLHLWDAMDPVNSCNCNADARGSIDALAWTTSEGLNLSKSVLSSYSYGIWAPLAWTLTTIICYSATIYFFTPPKTGGLIYKDKNLTKQNLKSILLFQLLMIAPLFVFGWDFGRWIFLWINSSISFFIFDCKIINIFKDNQLINEVGHISEIYPRRIRYLYLVFVGIPICCWTVENFFGSSPLGYLMMVVYRP
jgi:hypothetical protein